jgi:hypothetical protein
MRLCKDCKHHSVGRCEHPRFGKWIDYVAGRHRQLDRSCHDERAYTPWGLSWIFGLHRCGPQARYFEAKEPVKPVPSHPNVLGNPFVPRRTAIDEPPKPTPTEV